MLNLTLGEHGILRQAQQAGEKYKISEILEKLELEKVDLYARKNGEIPSLQEYIDHLINKGIITSADVQDVDDNTKNITVEGYVFTIVEESGNIKITYGGKADNTPKIAKIEVTKTTINSISVRAIASNGDGASYKYSIKNITAGETEFTEITTIGDNEYTFEGLTINNEYVIQVELITSDGGDIKETSIIKTEPPKVISITLDKTNIEIAKGGTDTITATVLPEEAIDKTLTWTSSNEDVVTVEVNEEDDTIVTVTAVGEGVTLITATANDGSEVSTNCNITVTPPPPPTAGVGADTHEAHEIQYTWEELSQIAKIISDNYGEAEEGKINNDTAEVNVSINGKSDTLGIGDWTTVKITEDDNTNEYQVRILGFNHDELATSRENEDGTTEAIAPQYGNGTTNTYAGISFVFTDALFTSSMNSSNSSVGGWGACKLRDTLNNTTINSLENKEYIKEVGKKYIKTFNDSNSLTISNDYLWLLSMYEIDAKSASTTSIAIIEDGIQYKIFTISIDCLVFGWRRTPVKNASGWFNHNTGSSQATVAKEVSPGFAI